MIEKTVLDNRIRVITETIPTAHSATIGFWVESGARHEDPAQSGISHFIEHMLFKGTAQRSALDIAKVVDAGGGVLNAFTSREFCCFYAKVLAKKLPQVVDLLSDTLLNSVFDHEEMEKERRVILQEIYMLEDTPDDQVHDLFSQHFWAGHPLGQSILGSRASVGALSRQMLLDFLHQRYCGANLLVCAAGDLEHQSIVDTIAQTFSHLPAGERVDCCALPDYRPQIHVVEKDLEQVHLCLGTRALPQDHPNRFASYLLNALLGSGMSSRLFQKIREEQGLAYSIYSYLNSHSDAGALVVYAGTSPENTAEVLTAILGELRTLKSETLAPSVLHDAKEQLKGQLLLSLESTDSRMTRLAKSEIYLGRQPSLKEVLWSIEGVSSEEIRKLCQFILQDDYLNLQVVGKADLAALSSSGLSLS